MVAVARYQIRQMTEADIAQGAEIERRPFPTPWPPPASRRERANRLARYLVVFDRSRAAPEQPPSRRKLIDALLRRREPLTTTDYVVGYVGVWLLVDEAPIVALAVGDASRPPGRRG